MVMLRERQRSRRIGGRGMIISMRMPIEAERREDVAPLQYLFDPQPAKHCLCAS